MKAEDDFNSRRLTRFPGFTSRGLPFGYGDDGDDALGGSLIVASGGSVGRC